MRYENLHQLIDSSSSSRAYFLSLPVFTQLGLHKQNEFIHTAEELHRFADTFKAYERFAPFR